MYKIHLSEPTLNGNEWKYVKECIDSEWVSSSGGYVDLFEQKIAEYTSSKYAVACASGTAAIQVSLRLAGVEPDNEVIVPTLTFIASINAISYCNARPIFMGTDNFYNMDSEKTIEFLENETVFRNGFTYNKKTDKKIAAILPVHVWGNAVWMDELVPLCEERNISIVEDAAEGLGTRFNSGKYSGKHVGTIGLLGCLSFNGNKIITTGGGGMILTDNEKLAEMARYITTQAKDDPVRYIHNEIGYNFRLSNIQAALGVAQLEQLPIFLKKKRNIFLQYKTLLKDIEGISLAKVPNYSDNNYWMNVLHFNSKVHIGGGKLIASRLEESGIQTRPVWTPNHLQKPYDNCQKYEIQNALDLHANSLCIPSSTSLLKSDIASICEIIHDK